MDMAAQHTLDRTARLHDRGQPFRPFVEQRIVESVDAAVERRMVHEEKRRLVALVEPRLQPLQLLRTKRAMALARHQGVERDQAQRQILDDVLEKSVARQVAVLGKGRPERIARIVVARDQIVGHAQRPEHALEVRVFLGLAAIDQIAGHQRDVGAGIERVDVRDGPLEEALRVDTAVKQLARLLDVHVGDLGNQH